MTKDEARPWLKIADAMKHEHGARLTAQEVAVLLEDVYVRGLVDQALAGRLERRRAVLRRSQAKHRARKAGSPEPV